MPVPCTAIPKVSPPSGALEKARVRTGALPGSVAQLMGAVSPPSSATRCSPPPGGATSASTPPAIGSKSWSSPWPASVRYCAAGVLPAVSSSVGTPEPLPPTSA